ncbi:MerR family transcriptional regulator [Geodermatophilus sp. DSM 45219]|uniref:MerR family transcriptional regulator n=1 Tax=Geodermatophilus sp. DSM 45219 TaxID=1881103 RepID=UPI000890AEA6|nr:MerR family transcriptional regulator [Geodermatophilus sp. DSM 45219]SDN39173.1 MerR HTH family regulatory protein [Geodermatophilus sp. DSM 45219]
MQISELARRAGVPVATVKYYLREGLLPPGELTGATRARYGEEHLSRLGLVRALLGPGGLSVATARAVLDAVDTPATSVHQALGAAHRALPGVGPDAPADLDQARALLRRQGWQVAEDSPALRALAGALEALRAAGSPPSEELLDRYAEAAGRIGEQDVAAVPTGSLADAVRFVVVNTVLLEPVLLALRRLAQEDASRRRFPGDR